MSRLPPIPRDQLSPSQQHAHDTLTSNTASGFGETFIFKRADGAMVGPFPFMLAAPEVGMDFMNYFLKLAVLPGLPKDAREIAILAVGAHHKAAFEMYAHTAVATKRAGVPPEIAKAVCEGHKPEGLSDACTVAYDVASYLAATPGPMPRELWNRSERVLGKVGTVALVHYVGAYAYTCIILNAMDAPVPSEGE